MSQTKRCPSCRGPMQRFFAEGIELDRCRACRGVWLDAGELADVLFRKVEPRQVAGPSERRCAFCARPMRTALLPGDVTVETCGSCRGLFLDEGELEQLTYGTESEAPLSTTVRADQRFLFFYCVACGERFHSHEARSGEDGLRCKTCAPSAPPPPAEEEQPVGRVAGWLRSWFGGAPS